MLSPLRCLLCVPWLLPLPGYCLCLVPVPWATASYLTYRLCPGLLSLPKAIAFALRDCIYPGLLLLRGAIGSKLNYWLCLMEVY